MPGGSSEKRSRVERLAVRLAAGTTRRSFLGRLAVIAAALLGGPSVARAFRIPGTEPTGDGYYGFCGHTWTTGSCPGPFATPRIDANGYPLRPIDGRPVDNLGRLIDAAGRPTDERGALLRGPSGALLPLAPRSRLCDDWVPERFGLAVVTQGVWYRCCSGQIRRLTDCCSHQRTRINGDAALTGYCNGGRTVFCVLYYDTGVAC
jgi:hypothetical protein